MDMVYRGLNYLIPLPIQELSKFLNEVEYMITSNDLFDIYYAFLLIRNDIGYELNSLVLDRIANSINSCVGDNAIRVGLSTIDGLDSSKWEFAFHNNLYTYRKLYNDIRITNLLTKLCLFLKQLIDASQLEQAYELTDAIHFFPILIDDNDGIISQKAIKRCLKGYQKKWGTLNFDI